MPDSGPDAPPPPLASYTTLRLGGRPDRLVVATTEAELVEAVQTGDRSGTPVLVVAGGSNLVVADEGFPGTVVLVATSGTTRDHTRDGVAVTVAAGTSWDGLVADMVSSGLAGVEALSGIPGSVGATPIQNVGAYGQEVADTVTSVRCWDRSVQVIRTLSAQECGFGYRTSRFKREPDRFVVLSVTFQLRDSPRSGPVRYAELARTLAVTPGEGAPLTEVRNAVLALRRTKGMVLDAEDADTWSAGSFFTNPLLSPAEAVTLPAEAPRWTQPDGSVKTSAAWLIERSGFPRGHGNERVRVSTKHTLALTNRGSASTGDLLALAGEIRQRVRDSFGVVLCNEPTLVGCELPPLLEA